MAKKQFALPYADCSSDIITLMFTQTIVIEFKQIKEKKRINQC